MGKVTPGKSQTSRAKTSSINQTSWHLRKQVGVIAYPTYSAFVAFLQVRRINIEIK